MSFSDTATSIAPSRNDAIPKEPSLAETARQFARQLRAATAADDAQDLDFALLQHVFGALCEFYAADVTQRERITPINTIEGASPTAVLMTTTALLRGANLELFELGMWQTWSGMK